MWIARWPLPALLTWMAAWAGFVLARAAGVSAWPALALATVLGTALALLHPARWRRVIAALGFPVSLLALGLPTGWPGWLWLAPLLALLLLYPRRAWTDAPLYPTPAGALAPLADLLRLPPGARVLDAGCGAGDGLRELVRALPAARVEGIEWSLPLSWIAARRVPRAAVRRGDMWAADWSGYDLVYLFQRPETMPRAWSKARAEMAPGSWLVSLDFAVPDLTPSHEWATASGRRVRAYSVQKAPSNAAN
jgi:SAM-dependent methyltransferase